MYCLRCSCQSKGNTDYRQQFAFNTWEFSSVRFLRRDFQCPNFPRWSCFFCLCCYIRLHSHFKNIYPFAVKTKPTHQASWCEYLVTPKSSQHSFHLFKQTSTKKKIVLSAPNLFEHAHALVSVSNQSSTQLLITSMMSPSSYLTILQVGARSLVQPKKKHLKTQ